MQIEILLPCEFKDLLCSMDEIAKIIKASPLNKNDEIAAFNSNGCIFLNEIEENDILFKNIFGITYWLAGGEDFLFNWVKDIEFYRLEISTTESSSSFLFLELSSISKFIYQKYSLWYRKTNFKFFNISIN
jgi:hypothetical protein